MAVAVRLLRPCRAGAAAWPSLAELLASPWSAAVLALVIGFAVVVGRLELVDHGDVTRFIGLGVVYTDRSGLPSGLFLGRGAGWDGQYFYRLALDPFDLHRTAFGITLDTPYRLQRIGYPALAWLAAAGRVGLVPWTLLGVNVLALGALGGLGAVLARDSGRHPMWGLLFAGYWGFPFSLSWDLTGAAEAALLVATLLALRRHRPGLATVALTVAVLTKETSLILVAAVALTYLLSGSPPASPRRHLVWAVPLAVFATWQLLIRVFGDGTGVGSDTVANLGLPLVALAREVGRDLHNFSYGASILDGAEIALLLGLVALAMVAGSRMPAPMHERTALVGFTTLALCLSSAVWGGQKDLRSLAELFTMAMVVLITSKRRLLVPAVLVGYAWSLVTVVQLTRL